MIGLSSNEDKWIQPIYSIETYAHGTSKDLELKKEEVKCNNTKKTVQKCLTLIILQRKT